MTPGAQPWSQGTGTRPVVLALTEHRIEALTSVLLAAEIATAQHASLRIVHVAGLRLWWSAVPGAAIPVDTWAEAERRDADQLRERVGSLLSLSPEVDWSFTWTRGSVYGTVMPLIRELAPIAVVVAPPRRRMFTRHRSVAWRLIGRPHIPAVVAPA